MANLPALGMRSMKAHLELEGAESEKINQVFERVRGHDSAVPMHQTATRPEEFQDDPHALYAIGDLPIMPSDGLKRMRHAFAVEMGYHGDIGLDAVREAMLVNDYNGDGDGTDILNYFMFSSPQLVADVERHLLRDDEVLCKLSWGKGSGVRTPWKVLVYMMDRLGGTHFRHHLLPREKGTTEKKACIPQDVIVSQYQFIKDNAPRGNLDCDQVMWIDFQLNDPQSPVHHRKEGKIKEVLSHIKDQSIQAKKITYSPLFIFDAGDEGVERAKRLAPTFKSHSYLMVGEPGEAKTPYLETLAFAMGDYYADKQGDRGLASYREAPDLDFFRAEEGAKYCPCVFDDGDLFEQRPKTLKAFLDVGQFQAMTRERWGAAKFVRGQARFAAENMYNEEAVPSLDAWRGLDVLPLERAKKMRNQYLCDMLQRTFPKDISKTNVAALLKRSSVVVNTPEDVFERLAGLDSDVTRSPKVGHFITAAAGKILYDYVDNGVMRNAEEHAALMDKQLRLMKACWIRSFGSIPASEIDISSSPEAPPAAAAVPSDQDIAMALADADEGDQLGLGAGMEGSG
ncbi:unnamed protein product [Prorocentrum cordatum]|uniref:PrkA AAA domain-containing protein n=1 Tax=Prorocentrum cordatum TaxID=2364126 RepID=A0ABN9YBW8_9DINO|nr:unnamed protein product [Polarella glacialis]